MTRSINSHTIIGNLGQDPETRYTADGKAITSFSVATSSRWIDKETGEQKSRTDWHNVVTFGKQAERAAEYLRKGSFIYVEGENRTSSYEKDGATLYRAQLVANKFKMLGAPTTQN